MAHGIRNGIRTARMRLVEPIPNSLNIVGELVFINYPGQPRTCRRCGGEGHVAAACRKTRCFNCWQAGHRVDECEEPEHSQICGGTEHRTGLCPFYIYSANVSPSLPGVSFATAIKTKVTSEKPAEKPVEKEVQLTPQQKPREQQKESHG